MIIKVGLQLGMPLNQALLPVTEETAMWPKEFRKRGKVKYESPQMRARKYTKDKHRCPLDVRKNPGLNGCFYTCMMFQKKFPTPNLARIKELYDKQIAKVEKEIG